MVFSCRWWGLFYSYSRKDAEIHLAEGRKAELTAGGSGEALAVLGCAP